MELDWPQARTTFLLLRLPRCPAEWVLRTWPPTYSHPFVALIRLLMCARYNWHRKFWVVAHTQYYLVVGHLLFLNTGNVQIVYHTQPNNGDGVVNTERILYLPGKYKIFIDTGLGYWPINSVTFHKRTYFQVVPCMAPTSNKPNCKRNMPTQVGRCLRSFGGFHQASLHYVARAKKWCRTSRTLRLSWDWFF